MLRVRLRKGEPLRGGSEKGIGVIPHPSRQRRGEEMGHPEKQETTHGDLPEWYHPVVLVANCGNHGPDSESLGHPAESNRYEGPIANSARI